MFSRNEITTLLQQYKLFLVTFCILLLSACDSGGFAEQPLSRDAKLHIIPITQIDGTPNTLTQVGLPFQFVAVDEIDGEYRDVSEQVTWHSSSPTVANISNAQATGIKKGVTLIHAQMGKRMSNQVELTVKDEPMLVLQIKTNEEDHPIGTLYNQLPAGAKQKLKAIATYADRTSFDVTQQVEWFTSQTDILQITDATANMLAKGSTDVHAIYLGYKSNTLPFIVTDASLEFLKISPAIASTATHSHQQFTAIATYSDYTSQDVTSHVTWHSTNTDVASVIQGEAEALMPGSAQITASLQTMTSTPAELTVTDAKLVKLQITPTEPELNLGDELFYKVKAIYDDGSTDDISDHVLWQSTNRDVSKVVASYAKATAAGQTEIKAHFNGIESNTSTLTVSEHQLVSLQLTPSLTELAQGTQAELKVIATYDDEATLDITDKVTWQTHDPEIVLINHGHVSAIKVGNTTIHAVFDEIESNDAKITVIDSSITALQITPAIETVPVSGTVDYIAQATFSDGNITTTQDVSHLVAWKSLHHDIATLTHGSAIGVKQGDAKILAILNGTHQTAHLTVSDKKMTALQVTPAQQTLAQGSRSQYTAIATYDDNSTEDVTALANWSTSNDSVATLYSGEVEAVSAGQVSISANYHGINSNQAQLTVENIQLAAIQVTPATSDIQIGTNQHYRALGIYSNNTSQDITDLVHWKSSNTDIATIVLNQTTINTASQDTQQTENAPSSTDDSAAETLAIATGITAGTALISADYEGIESNQATLVVNAATLQSLQITPANIELAMGTNVQYKVMGHYSDGSNIDVTDSVNWINSQPQIATIVAGEAVAINQGSTQIKASLQDITSNPTTLTVTAATLTALQVTPASSNIANGTDQQYEAIASYSDNSTQNVTELVAWQSSDTNIATIEQGLAHANNIGHTQISAHLADISSNSANLTVTNAVLQELVLTPSEATVANGTDQDYIVIAHYSDGTTKEVSHQVNWHNSNPNSVIFEDNHAHTLSPGTSNIYASINNINSNQVKLTVTAAVIKTIQLTPANSQQASGTDLQYQAIATYSDSSTQDISEDVSWISNNTAIATIDDNGIAHTQQPGTTQIQAKHDGISSNSALLEVTSAKVTSIQVTPAIQTVSLGITQQYTAIATYTDSSVQDVTEQAAWHSSNIVNATVINGLAETLAKGSVNIRATFDDITSNQAQLTISDKKVTKLQLTPTDMELAKGTSEVLQVKATYTDGSTRDVTSDVTWQLSDNTVASIDTTTNILTANKQGNITLKAIWPQDNINSNTAMISVTAAQLTSLHITPELHEIIAHNSASFEAFGQYSDGSNQDLTTQVDWSSSNSVLATVLNGLVDAHEPGTVTISAIFNGISANAASVTVLSDTLQSITVTPTNINIPKATTQQFTAIGHYLSGMQVDITQNHGVSWSSNSANITIDENGLATAIAEQQSITISATKSGITGQSTINATAAIPVSLVIEKREPARTTVITNGTRFDLRAIATMSDNTVVDVTTTADWHEDSSSVHAIVTSIGRVQAKQPGISNVNAQYQGVVSTNTIQFEAIPRANYTCEIPEITFDYNGNSLTFFCPVTTDEYPTDTFLTGNGGAAPGGRTIPLVSWFEARDYCDSKGLRLPTRPELIALIEHANTPKNSGSYLYTVFDWHVQRNYWSQSAESGSRYWTINMSSRYNWLTGADDGNDHSFSCVRDN